MVTLCDIFHCADFSTFGFRITRAAHSPHHVFSEFKAIFYEGKHNKHDIVQRKNKEKEKKEQTMKELKK